LKITQTKPKTAANQKSQNIQNKTMRDGQTVDSSNQVGKNKPKTAIDMFRSTYQKSWNLEYNKRAFIKNFDSAN